MLISGNPLPEWPEAFVEVWKVQLVVICDQFLDAFQRKEEKLKQIIQSHPLRGKDGRVLYPAGRYDELVSVELLPDEQKILGTLEKSLTLKELKTIAESKPSKSFMQYVQDFWEELCGHPRRRLAHSLGYNRANRHDTAVWNSLCKSFDDACRAENDLEHAFDYKPKVEAFKNALLENDGDKVLLTPYAFERLQEEVERYTAEPHTHIYTGDWCCAESVSPFKQAIWQEEIKNYATRKLVNLYGGREQFYKESRDLGGEAYYQRAAELVGKPYADYLRKAYRRIQSLGNDFGHPGVFWEVYNPN